MRTLGLLLLVAGIIVLANKGFSYRKTTKIVDLGPVQASVERTKHVYLEPLIGVSGVGGGLALLLLARKRKEA